MSGTFENGVEVYDASDYWSSNEEVEVMFPETRIKFESIQDMQIIGSIATRPLIEILES